MFLKALLLASLFSSFSFASEDLQTPELLKDHEQYGIFTYFPSIPNALFILDKSIPSNHELELRKALNGLRQVDTIVLNSPGGDVYSALNMAGVIHDRNLNTYISPNANCASACSFMFLAGGSRLSEGQLGVHQFAPNRDSTEKRSQSISMAQFTMSDLYGVLSSFDVPDFVIVKMFDTPPSDMYFFSDRQLKDIKRGDISAELIKSINDLTNTYDDFILRAREVVLLEKTNLSEPITEPTTIETDGNMDGSWELNSTCNLGKGRLEVTRGVSEGSKFVHKVKYILSSNEEIFSGNLTVWTGSAIEISLKPSSENSVYTNKIRIIGKINAKRDGFVADITPHCKTKGSWLDKANF